MSLNSNALVTVATAKVHLDIPSADVSQDAKLELYINTASERVERYLDRKLIYQAHTERQDGRSSDRIMLRQYPAEKPTALYDDPAWDFLTPYEASQYDIEDAGVVVLRYGRFMRANLNIKVIYNAGYKSVVSPGAGPNLPADLQHACLLLVEWMYQMRADRRLGVKGKAKNQENISFSQGMPPEVIELLEPHRRLDAPLTPSSVGNS
jgi:uncharacterized phiE125 gp8 family phage protein